MKTNKWLVLGVVLLTSVGVSLALGIHFFGGPLWIADFGNVLLLASLVGVVCYGVNKSLNKMSLDSSLFFKDKDNKFHKLQSLKYGFSILGASIFAFLALYFIDSLRGRAFWFAYLFVALCVCLLFLLVFLFVLFFINRLVYLASPYKNVVYKWESLPASSHKCIHCSSRETAITYGVFTVTKKKGQSLWLWWFKPLWRYASDVSFCSRKCLMEELSIYAYTVHNT
jgi:hypothetical protein